MSSAPPITPEHPFYPLYNLLVDFKQRHVQPPSMYYVTRDDVLQLTIAAPAVQTTVNLSLRFMSAQGEVLPRYETFTVGPTTGTPVIETLQNAEGYLLSASVFTPNAPRGQCFVSLAIKRGGGTGDNTFGDILLQGYPGQVGGIAYPQTQIQDPLSGRGRIRVVTVANPAAGADWSETVPAGVTWQLLAVNATLTTSSAVANRDVTLVATDASSDVLWQSSPGLNQGASTALGYAFFQGNSIAASLVAYLATLPIAMRLLAGFIIKTSTANIQAADQWSAIVLTVEEFIGG